MSSDESDSGGPAPARRTSSNDPFSFDLSEVSRRLYREWLRRKWLANLAMAGFISILGILFVVFAIAEAFSQGITGPSEADLVIAAWFLSMGYVLYFVGNARTRKPATGLLLRSDALVVEYGPRRKLVMRWDSPRFRLRISRMNSETLGVPIDYSLFWFYPRLFVPVEYSETIASFASARGLRVESAKDGDSSTGEAVLIRAR